jgi:hypothetical protein
MTTADLPAILSPRLKRIVCVTLGCRVSVKALSKIPC